MNYRVAYSEVDLLYKTIQDAAPDKEHSTAYLAGALHALLVNILQNNHEALDCIHRHRAIFKGER
mgnify:CR=1 FL=1